MTRRAPEDVITYAIARQAAQRMRDECESGSEKLHEDWLTDLVFLGALTVQTIIDETKQRMAEEQDEYMKALVGDRQIVAKLFPPMKDGETIEGYDWYHGTMQPGDRFKPRAIYVEQNVWGGDGVAGIQKRCAYRSSGTWKLLPIEDDPNAYDAYRHGNGPGQNA
jgi:hypothetical protein